jgi:hypothetical protein
VKADNAEQIGAAAGQLQDRGASKAEANRRNTTCPHCAFA